MKVYNVTSTVVALVRADDEDDALARLRAALDRAGFEPYPCVDDGAFESEEVPDDHVLDLPPATNWLTPRAAEVAEERHEEAKHTLGELADRAIELIDGGMDPMLAVEKATEGHLPAVRKAVREEVIDLPPR